MDSPRSWDSLQKQVAAVTLPPARLRARLLHKARKLEERLDYQMLLYRKLISRKAGCGTESNLGSGIEQLLKQLQKVISEMHAWVSSGGSETEMFSYPLIRHQEIHRDLNQEFNRLRSTLRGSKEQSQLKEHATLIRSAGQLNSILRAIKKKKSMDSIILSSVASVCTFLVLICWMRE